MIKEEGYINDIITANTQKDEVGELASTLSLGKLHLKTIEDAAKLAGHEPKEINAELREKALNNITPVDIKKLEQETDQLISTVLKQHAGANNWKIGIVSSLLATILSTIVVGSFHFYRTEYGFNNKQELFQKSVNQRLDKIIDSQSKD